MTYRELLQEGERVLLEAEVPESRLDAWYLFSHCFSMDRAAYFLRMETEPSEEEAGAAGRFRRLVGQRAERIPLQQLLKNQEFMGLSIFVNEHVLVPRQDTETLAETALAGERAWAEKALPAEEKERRPYRILDLCTGSGCVGLSLAAGLEKEGPKVVLSDVSPEALRVAEENIRRLGMEKRCRTVESDLFDAFSGRQFDCIVSNPPYIPSGEIKTLMPEVRDHEPGIALDGSPDGLAFYRRIADKAAEHLTPDGRLFLEIGWDQGRAVSEILRSAGFRFVEVVRDLAGNDRVVKAVRPE